MMANRWPTLGRLRDWSFIQNIGVSEAAFLGDHCCIFPPPLPSTPGRKDCAGKVYYSWTILTVHPLARTSFAAPPSVPRNRTSFDRWHVRHQGRQSSSDGCPLAPWTSSPWSWIGTIPCIFLPPRLLVHCHGVGPSWGGIFYRL